MNGIKDCVKSFPSVCIPRTFTNTTWREVRDIFEGIVGRGCVDRIDMVNKINRRGESYQCVFIHLLEWPDNECAAKVRERLIEGHDIKLVYDDPWFWKCSVSRLPKPVARSYVPRDNKARARINTRARDLKDAERRPHHLSSVIVDCY
jgi:hypothetical protein